VRERRRTRIGADRLRPRRRASRDARVPERVAGEHELPGAREQQHEEWEQRHELRRRLPPLAGEKSRYGWRERRRHARSIEPPPVTGLRAFVTKVRQYDV
jgi:hypothetical protein